MTKTRKGATGSIFQAWFATESISFRIRALKARLRDQKAEFDTIRRHLRPSDIACDIGANKGSFICRDRLLPLAEFDADVHQRQHGERFWKSRDYFNNFVFVKG